MYEWGKIKKHVTAQPGREKPGWQQGQKEEEAGHHENTGHKRE
jgi:hypothetical protein